MSEFGLGYATCLRQFSNHRIRLVEMVALYADLRKKRPSDDDLFQPSSAAELWMNGASDHLYDLIKPRRGINIPTWQKARALQARAIDIGHGFRRDTTPQECEQLLDTADALLWLTKTETLDEALAWDQDHGLKPDRGSWNCPYDLVKVFM